MIFVLQNIRSAWNVGSIFRTADAVGALVVCLGYTARPEGDYIKMIAKTAIGAEKTVSWKPAATIQDVLGLYPKQQGFVHYAIEINDTSVDLLEYLKLNQNLDLDKVVLWLGNEIGGVDQLALEACDHITHLPMVGLKESLNVANTATAVAYLFLQSSIK
jgi:23S rRNA (guanosine2251-2'-O)-methyltransferase